MKMHISVNTYSYIYVNTSILQYVNTSILQYVNTSIHIDVLLKPFSQETSQVEVSYAV